MSIAGDYFIEANGIDVTIYTVTSEVFDIDYDELDWEASTKSTTQTKMLIGNRKSEAASLKKSDEGWDQQDPLLQVYFPSDTDISPRNGYDADVVVIDSTSERYRVNRTDFDTILGVTKKKVFLEALRGGEQG